MRRPPVHSAALTSRRGFDAHAAAAVSGGRAVTDRAAACNADERTTTVGPQCAGIAAADRRERLASTAAAGQRRRVDRQLGDVALDDVSNRAAAHAGAAVSGGRAVAAAAEGGGRDDVADRAAAHAAAAEGGGRDDVADRAAAHAAAAEGADRAGAHAAAAESGGRDDVVADRAAAFFLFSVAFSEAALRCARALFICLPALASGRPFFFGYAVLV
jgi:hypothetical protein